MEVRKPNPGRVRPGSPGAGRRETLLCEAFPCSIDRTTGWQCWLRISPGGEAAPQPLEPQSPCQATSTHTNSQKAHTLIYKIRLSLRMKMSPGKIQGRCLGLCSVLKARLTPPCSPEATLESHQRLCNKVWVLSATHPYPHICF